jgi:hypothetical protein
MKPGLSSVEVTASEKFEALLAYVRAEIAEFRDVSLPYSDMAMLMTALDARGRVAAAAQTIADAKHPPIAVMLRRHGYEWEARTIEKLVEAVGS